MSFKGTQHKRDFLAGMLFDMNAEENLLQIGSSSQTSRRVCETVGLDDRELSEMHEVEVHARSLPEIQFNLRWNEHLVIQVIHKEN